MQRLVVNRFYRFSLYAVRQRRISLRVLDYILVGLFLSIGIKKKGLRRKTLDDRVVVSVCVYIPPIIHERYPPDK